MCLLYSNLNINIADITGGHVNKAICKDFKQPEAESRSSPQIPPRWDQQTPWLFLPCVYAWHCLRGSWYRLHKLIPKIYWKVFSMKLRQHDLLVKTCDLLRELLWIELFNKRSVRFYYTFMETIKYVFQSKDNLCRMYNIST